METASASDIFLITRACMIAVSAVAAPTFNIPVKVDDITQVLRFSQATVATRQASLLISNIFNKFFQRSRISFKQNKIKK